MTDVSERPLATIPRRLVAPPLPHPSWGAASQGGRRPSRALDADAFWRRLEL